MLWPGRKPSQRNATPPASTPSRYVDDEERFQSVGFTDSGRWLCVITVERGEKIRVITAYDANKRHVEMHLRIRGAL
jgi:uncharacterized DUF497 family protein